jgi:large conductance mechanosensitive channel
VLKGFKEFLFRGNLVDLAVAVTIGGAFGTVVSALVKDLLTPLIAALVGKPDFSGLTFTVNASRFLYGDFINAVVSFVLAGAAVYFLVVVPTNAIATRMSKPGTATPSATRPCPECLNEIPIRARRCGHCTSAVGASA